EIGFSPNGYTINTISGQTLTLNSPMPISITQGKFSVNRTQFSVTSDIDIVPNIMVTTIHDMLSGNDMSTTNGSNIVTSASTDFTALEVLPGYILRIDDPGLETTYSILQASGNSLTINSNLPLTLS